MRITKMNVMQNDDNKKNYEILLMLTVAGCVIMGTKVKKLMKLTGIIMMREAFENDDADNGGKEERRDLLCVGCRFCSRNLHLTDVQLQLLLRDVIPGADYGHPKEALHWPIILVL